MIYHSIIVLRSFILSSLLLLVTIPVFGQNKLIIKPSFMPPSLDGMHVHPIQSGGRPKVGLVFSGGGGRGLAQIGVLRALERHNISIDLIIGNSLGSVVGGLYAAGYSTTEIESIAIYTNWNELLSFSEETKRTDLFVGQKQAHEEGFLLIRFDGLQPIIPSSISSGQRLSNFFSYLTLQALYHPNPSFDDLKIPFRATATDLLTGKRVIMDHGSLAEAMRASVTVPLLYSPIERDSMFLVDGGLVSNIPADVARSLGCDVVIVVNSTSSMRKSDQLNAPWEIADQIMSIMMQEANARQLQLADVVITPGGGDRIVSDFTGIDKLIELGERVTEESMPKILDAIHARTKTTSSLSVDPFRRALLDFQGDSLPHEIKQELSNYAETRSLSPLRIEESLNRIYATGMYQEVYAEVTEAGSPTDVKVHAVANPALTDVQFFGNELVPDEDIRRAIASCKATNFSYVEIQKAMENILTMYRKRGYSLARIESLHVDPLKGSLQFRINEGRIAQIRYEGNDRTRDYVIRREFPLDEGDVFNMDKAYQGIVNIKSTGLFDYVLLDVRYTNNQPVIVLKVNEKSSELLRLGFHADDERSVVTTVDIRDANFRGAWEDLGVVMRYGDRDRAIGLEYTVNRIFHSYFTLNLNGFFKSRDVNTYRDDQSLPSERWERVEDGRYRESRYGWSLAFGSHYERLGDVLAELRWTNHKVAPLSGQGYIPEQYRYVGVKLQSIVDTEDKFSFPTKGVLISVSY
ncbi:MAG: patatin-like phospholipase family protein, partial [Ignavibacteria bacterium]|nr:patatin-like phospholipase family protein [Ignavibacteria bacterium]